MDEQLFYIESNIVGKWGNERHSFIIGEKDANNKRDIKIITKDDIQQSQSVFECYIHCSTPNCILTMVDKTINPNTYQEYSIYIDASINKLTLNSNGITWELTKSV